MLERKNEAQPRINAASPANANGQYRMLIIRVLVWVVPVIGFELMTYRLQGGCSTN